MFPHSVHFWPLGRVKEKASNKLIRILEAVCEVLHTLESRGKQPGAGSKFTLCLIRFNWTGKQIIAGVRGGDIWGLPRRYWTRYTCSRPSPIHTFPTWHSCESVFCGHMCPVSLSPARAHGHPHWPPTGPSLWGLSSFLLPHSNPVFSVLSFLYLSNPP